MSEWRPPFWIVKRHYRGHPAVGMVLAYERGAWEVTHVSEAVDGDEIRATFRRLHGPRHERENGYRDMAVSYPATGANFTEYHTGRVWLCSCCGDPAPCRMQDAEEQSVEAAAEFEKRLKRMGPGICYGCGEVITSRQERVTFPGEHADFPGRSGPTFHTRGKCYGERAAYARRANVTPEALPLGTEVAS